MEKSENIVVNGREFLLLTRQSEHEGRSYWVGWVEVIGRERLLGGSWSVGPCISEEELRQKALASMQKYLS